MTTEPYYQHDLALVHARGYGLHAERCAPGVLALLEPVRGGLVLEIGCGTGALTRHLLAAGHRVLATDASPAMLDVARETLGPSAEIARLTLPQDPLPEADAIVGIGHAVSYLASAAEIDLALTAMAQALRPGFPCRHRTGSSGTSRPSCQMGATPGGATASTTRTCWSTRPGYRNCFGHMEYRPGCGARSGTKNCPRA
jgi:SAM-dependent methyltransferase